MHGSEKVAADIDRVGSMGELRRRTQADGQSDNEDTENATPKTTLPQNRRRQACAFVSLHLLTCLFHFLCEAGIAYGLSCDSFDTTFDVAVEGKGGTFAGMHCMHNTGWRTADTSRSDDEVRVLSANQRFIST